MVLPLAGDGAAVQCACFARHARERRLASQPVLRRQVPTPPAHVACLICLVAAGCHHGAIPHHHAPHRHLVLPKGVGGLREGRKGASVDGTGSGRRRRQAAALHTCCSAARMNRRSSGVHSMLSDIACEVWARAAMAGREDAQGRVRSARRGMQQSQGRRDTIDLAKRRGSPALCTWRRQRGAASLATPATRCRSMCVTHSLAS